MTRDARSLCAPLLFDVCDASLTLRTIMQIFALLFSVVPIQIIEARGHLLLAPKRLVQQDHLATQQSIICGIGRSTFISDVS